MTATFVLLLLHARLGGRDRDMGYRTLWCIALWMLFLLTLTEGLSLLHLLRFRVLLLCWGGAAAVLAGTLLLRVRALARRGTPLRLPCPQAKWLLAVLPAVALGALAVYTVPYNFDSMTYHLSRIAHWAQEGSVAHYATNIVRQLVNPTLTEFTDLHVYILCAKNDLLIHLPQAAAHVACAGLVYAISRKLGCAVGPSALAGALCFAMPIAFAQAISTQTDGFAAVWLLGFAYLILDFTRPEDKLRLDAPSYGRVVLMGLMVAFGYLSKPTVSIGMLLLAVWLLVICIVRRDDPRVIGGLILCALPAVALPILPEAARNLHTFGSVTLPVMSQNQIVGSFRPNYLLINLCKNLTINMPTHLILRSERILHDLVTGLADLVGVPVGAPALGHEYVVYTPPMYWHDNAVSPLVFYAAMTAAVLAVVRRLRTGRKGLLHSYTLAVLLVFLCYCTVLRWDGYGSRYMLGYLALLCPTVACSMQKLQKSESKALYGGVLAFLCAAELISLGIYHSEVAGQNGSRPLGYFGANTTVLAPYMDLCRLMVESGSREWGLVVREGDYEYPIWCMAQVNGAHIEHMQVENASAMYEDMTYTPDCVFWAGELPGYTQTLHGAVYELWSSTGEFSVLVRSDAAAP